MKKLFQHKNGFTLLEVLVAIVLLTVGMLGVASLAVGVIKGNTYSKHVTTATTIAQQQIEQAKRVGYTNLASLVETNTAVSMGDKSFNRTTAVTNGSPAANMKTIAVTVSWNPGNYSVSLNTTISQ